jgi:hypothetical protein
MRAESGIHMPAVDSSPHFPTDGAESNESGLRTAGIQAVLEKPFSGDQLLSAVLAAAGGAEPEPGEMIASLFPPNYCKMCN